MFAGENYYLTKDRYGNFDSAMRLENGYRKVLSDIYFENDITITGWVIPYDLPILGMENGMTLFTLV